MRANDLVLVQGMRDTRSTLAAWNQAPWPVLRGWLAGSVAVAVALLLTTWLIGVVSTPDATRLGFPGLPPHAFPELVALFLPLAAWIIASRRDQWNQLLAATFVTAGIAIPVLVASSVVEVYVTPHLLRALAG